MSSFFGFESAQERSLALIPMLVRMKLDQCGIRLSLAQWNQLPEPDRRRLFELPCERTDQIDAYGALLSRLVEIHAREAVRRQAPSPALWNDVQAVPGQVARRAEQVGIAPPSLEQWRALSAPQRYALLKLTREGHDSPNYLPALREFALL